MATPPLSRFEHLYNEAASVHGLQPAAAYGYAVLGWWLEHFGITAPPITSGHRDASRQAMLRAAWDSWQRNGRRGPAPYGMIARPALNSAHTRGDAFDVSARTPREVLEVMAEWAPHVGLRWGGYFADPDPVHFDTGSHL